MSLGPNCATGDNDLATTRRRFAAGALKRAARLAVCLGLAAALPLASAGVASAAPRGGHGSHGNPPSQVPRPARGPRHEVAGTVVSLTADGFTLAGPKGATVEVNVSASTTYREPKIGRGGPPQVMVGDKVKVVGTEAGPGALDATLVLVPALRATGTVASVGTASFVLTLTASTLTVDVSPATIYREPTVRSPALADVLAGEKVAVTGAQVGAGTIDATTVMVRVVVRAGRVTSVSAGGFTLATAKGASTTVDVSPSTKFHGPKGASPKVSVGDQVRVIGTDAGPGTINALSVSLNSSAGHDHQH